MTRPAILEICVDSPEGVLAAVQGGADRVELCGALALGGVTPGPGLMAACADIDVPCHAMIRPRAGDFRPRTADLEVMLDDISAAHASGLAGVVVGAAMLDGRLDVPVLRKLRQAADGMDVTLHRVIDLTPDPFVAIDEAVELGMTRILTSGQKLRAPDGAALIADMVRHAAGRIEIMAGGGVTLGEIPALLATGVAAIHASCSAADPAEMDCTAIGIAPGRITDRDSVAAFKAAIAGALVQ